MRRTRCLILGAAGRDFHTFNTLFRDDGAREVVAFTAAQIPYIVGRTYPPALAGSHYPRGIPIHDESELEVLIAKESIDEVIFAYSDISYEELMHLAARTQAAGASFTVPDLRASMLVARRPVIAVGAVRTGCGKSQTARFVATLLRARGLRVAVLRHPMPYGDLAAQRVQRFATRADLAQHDVTIEEREEYEPHLDAGNLVFAGVDYEAILRAAELEADVILWDGGNNDVSFVRPDLTVVLADPHRAGDEGRFYPGEVNARLADVFVINKEDSATAEQIRALEESLRRLNPRAVVAHATSRLTVDDATAIAGKRVVCVEDGPTLTHGGMRFGAAVLAAERGGAAAIVDPRPWAQGSLREVFRTYPHTGPVLPAMGYRPAQVQDLAATLDRVECDLVVIGTPIDLRKVLTLNKPSVRVRYDLEERGEQRLRDAVLLFLRDHHLGEGPLPTPRSRDAAAEAR